MDERKQIYIGTDDFTKIIREHYYYVDKSLLIRELLDKPAEVTLFTRPRRFGKTMNMLMLKAYFENIPGGEVLFQNLKIWQCGSQYRLEQGRYPVIFLTLKDIRQVSWPGMYEELVEIIRKEYHRHYALGHFNGLDPYQTADVEAYLNRKASEAQMVHALSNLTCYLHAAIGVRPWILIDEYDAPIMRAYEAGCEKEAIRFLSSFLSAAMKTNEHLERSVLTGVMRVAQTDIFSGFNNVCVRSVLDSDFNTQFGFTQEEVEEIADYYEVRDKIPELKEWYNGYLFGGSDIYNPWSVMCYFANNCRPQAYWTSTSSSGVLNQVLKKTTPVTVKNLTALLNGEVVEAAVRTNLTYKQLTGDSQSHVYSLLLMAGYLKPVTFENLRLDKYDYSGIVGLKIPNKEIAEVYRTEVFELLTGEEDDSLRFSISEALAADDDSGLQKVLREFMTNVVSFYDTAAEGFYHALVLGLVAASDGRYCIRSNREAGDGRYDLLLVNSREKKGILIEFKTVKIELDSAEETYDKLTELAREQAISQINQKRYDSELESLGITSIVKYGIACSKKYISVVKA